MLKHSYDSATGPFGDGSLSPECEYESADRPHTVLRHEIKKQMYLSKHETKLF